MENNIGIIINDNLLSTSLIKSIIVEKKLNLEFIIVEKKNKKKTYLFFIIFFKDFFKIFKKITSSFFNRENIKNICKKNDINNLITKNINSNQVLKFINNHNVKNIFFINLCSKFKLNNKELNKFNFINIHLGDTLKYKGVFCLIHSIINNEEYFSITSHFVTNRFDEGKIIYQKKIKLYQECLFDLYYKLFLQKREVIYETLKLIDNSNYIVNLNKSVTYKPPTLMELRTFFKNYKNYKSK